MSEDTSVPADSAYLAPPVAVVTVNDYPTTDSTSTNDSPSTKDVAKEQISNVGDTVSDAGQHVTAVAKDQASNVAAEASTQAKNLLGQTRTELQQQAATQQQRIAAGIRSLSDELGSMAANSEQSGTASDLASQASARAGALAGWLEDRDPGSLLSEVSDFARRRPGAFLAIAAGAGLLAGRLTRGAVAAAHDDAGTEPSTPAAAPTAPVVQVTPLTGVPGETGYESAEYEPLEPWDGQVRS